MIDRSIISGNIIKGADGAGSAAPPTDGLGGGIYSEGPLLKIRNSTISDNYTYGGDCLWSEDQECFAGAGRGGGVYIDYLASGLYTITNTVISSNDCFGGVCDWNDYCYNGLGGDAYGGGIYSSKYTFEVNSCTISGNYVLGGYGDPWVGDGVSYGGGFYGVGHLNNVILANNQADIGNDCNGSIVSSILSMDYNLIMDTSDCAISGLETHNIYGQYLYIDAGSCQVSGLTFDQRGLSRPRDLPGYANVDDGCDIGAIEEYAPLSGDVVINEIAWSGTSASPDDEWLELFNMTPASIDVTGWTIQAQDGTPQINLSGTIDAHAFFVIERDNDLTISDITADQIYTGELDDSGEQLTLLDDAWNTIDTANINGGFWPAGTVSGYYSMERINSTLPDTDDNWHSNDGTIINGLDANSDPINGTPGAQNSGSIIIIGDYVWGDENENGIQETLENGLENVEVRLYDLSFTLVDTSFTDSDGLFVFDNIVTGHYLLEFILPEGYTYSPQNQGSDDTLDSDVDPKTGWTSIICVSPSEQNLTCDAGLIPYAVPVLSPLMMIVLLFMTSICMVFGMKKRPKQV